MGTHPIFESDFDCLTACRDRFGFSVSVRFSSVRTKIFSFGSVLGHQNEKFLPNLYPCSLSCPKACQGPYILSLNLFGLPVYSTAIKKACQVTCLDFELMTEKPVCQPVFIDRLRRLDHDPSIYPSQTGTYKKPGSL